MDAGTLIKLATELDTGLAFIEFLKQFSSNAPLRVLLDMPPQHYLRVHGLILRLGALQYPRPKIREIEQRAMDAMKANVKKEFQWTHEIEQDRKIQLADQYMQVVIPALIEHLDSINVDETISNYKLWSAEKR